MRLIYIFIGFSLGFVLYTMIYIVIYKIYFQQCLYSVKFVDNVRSDNPSTGEQYLRRQDVNENGISFTLSEQSNTSLSTTKYIVNAVTTCCDIVMSGNPLIDDYGQNDLSRPGENGTGITLSVPEQKYASFLLKKYNINVVASDKIPLNRMVPDSRYRGCKAKSYVNDLPKTSIIIPFYDEWPSILKRTIYSIINRTPNHLLQEIILVDDFSNMEELKAPFDDYIRRHFPKDLIKVIRNPKREGLIKAKITGWRSSNGEVIVFFDSHMEVNIEWLPPLLTAIEQDRTIIAMANLDYINANDFKYTFYSNNIVRYVFDWSLLFLESYFREDQIGHTDEDMRPGTVMVGAAFAIDRKYFGEIGAYDEGMKIWGGENLELAWRAWMCGGKLMHIPCSHIGHIARVQPYLSLHEDRIKIYNYKRAIEVWFEPHHKEFVYQIYPQMRYIDVGVLTERFKLKEKLHCKNFTWFLSNIYPELLVYNHDVLAWGSVRNLKNGKCLDNKGYLHQRAAQFETETCHFQLHRQTLSWFKSILPLEFLPNDWQVPERLYFITLVGLDQFNLKVHSFTQLKQDFILIKGFSWTKEQLLRTTLHCVVVQGELEGTRPQIKSCVGGGDKWLHVKNFQIKHVRSGLCLDYDRNGLFMSRCSNLTSSQFWNFTKYNF